MLISLIKKISLYIIIPLLIVLTGVALLIIATQKFPDNIEFTVADNFGLYINLINANPLMAIKLALIDNPLILIERLDEQRINQVWGFYIMPVNAFTLLFISIFIVHIRKFNLNSCKWVIIWSSILTIMFSMYYLRLQTCCTTKPTWILEIWLFSQTSAPLADTTFWKDIYIKLIGQFIYIQFSIASVATVILYIASYSQILCKNNKNPDD